MGSHDGSGPQRRPEAYDRLEQAVRRLFDRHDQLRKRIAVGETRTRELERTVRRLATGELDPVALQERVDELEAENRALHERVDAARARVLRLLERFDFIEEEL